MAFLLENISLNSKPEEFERFKQKHPFVRSMEEEMERQFTKKTKVKQVFVPENPKPNVSIEVWVRTVLWYRGFDLCRLADSNII